ncbi:MAG: hypothetical protein IJH69_06405, partial [Firmicutes bacterium]|nr:hypothetical protein [Bacillota bacterium]
MSNRKERIKEIYEMLNRYELLDYDCGRLCGTACCTAGGSYGDENMGIYLLPGEEELLKDEDWL